MAEMILSAGVELAWQAAGDLALSNNDPLIEPIHILYGICSIEKLISRQDRNLETDPNRAAQAKTEAVSLRDTAQRNGIELGAVRRTIREFSREQRQRVALTVTADHRISRSLAAKATFEAASQVALERGERELNVLFLLGAVLNANDGNVEKVTAKFKNSLAHMLDELSIVESKETLLPIRGATGVHDLDQQADMDSRTLQIGETIDATLHVQPKSISSAAQSLTYLSDLTWEFGTQGRLEFMLQKAAEQVLRIVCGAERSAILVRDVVNGELLLKAHGPAGTMPTVSLTLASNAMAEKKGFVWSRGEDLTLSLRESSVQTGMYVPLVVNGGSIGALCLDSSAQSECFGAEDLLLLTTFAHQLALAIANHELKVALKQNTDVLERLLTNFSPKVRTRLLQRARNGRLRLGGERSVVSVLCSDIRGFTRISADMDTEDIVSMLNEYFAALTDCIFRHDGTVDKFVGDAILAVFGSPEVDPQHHRNAIVVAMEMQHAMEELNRQRSAQGHATCQVGIGVHSGEVFHGFIGSPERMEFTIIGDAVNRAARYCDGAKPSEVLISPEVYQHVWRMIEAEPTIIATKHEGDLQAYRVKRLRTAAT